MFSQYRRVRPGFASAGLLLSLAAVGSNHQATAATDPGTIFSYQDYLNHAWTNELVSVPLSADQTERLKSKPALLDSDGTSVPYQTGVAGDGQTPTIEFLANVKAGQAASYKFSAVPNSAATTPATDLRVEETADTIRLTNSVIGIALRKTLQPGDGPVAQIRLESGKWIGGSSLGKDLAVTGYTAKVIASGPVVDEVECRTEFAGGGNWVLDFQLQANEPVVEVRENMALGDGDSTFSLKLSQDFDPDHMFFRSGVDGHGLQIGSNTTKLLQVTPNGNTFVLEPWLRWYVRPEEGPVFSLYSDDSPDMLSVGAGFASLWVDPKIPPEKRTPPLANLMKDNAGLALTFDLRNGQRQWMIITPDKDESLKAQNDPSTLTGPSLPHEYVIKHGQFPLNLVKDYVLDWPNAGDPHPSLLFTKAREASFRAAHAQDPPLTDQQVAGLVSQKPINEFNMQAPLTAYFATGNPVVTKFLVSESEGATQSLVDTFLIQPTVPYGSAPHHLQALGSMPLLLDAILDDPTVTPELRKKLLAQIAFCSYAVNRDDFWSEERGYSANPNMTTSVLGYRAGFASLIPSHPMARQWVTNAFAGLKTILYDWSDDNGGWLEAPHYAMTSYDVLLGSSIMAHNAGLSDMLFDPRMKLVINWFSKWSTPKDSRILGMRHLPPVGNTFMFEPTGEFGIVAAAWKDQDPEFASQMEWMFRQQNSVEFPGVGGGAPTMAGYRHLLLDDSITPKAPPWGSELFPHTGVVLRNGYPSDHETYLLLLQGNFDGWRSHYDDDSGSVTIWGKGRIVSDDFGYYTPAAEDHSLPVAPEIEAGRTLNVSTFAPSKDFDYVSGNRGPWNRQIALVKNDDPLAPNFFVFTDTFKTANPATWRMCFTADSVTPNGQSVAVVGQEDVDTDLFFTTPPAVPLTTEVKTRTSNSGLHPDGQTGPLKTTQIALVATAPTDGAMTYVLYPRLKTEKPPEFTAIAGGNGVKVETETETDYVFVSNTPVTWSGDGVTFTGKSGAARLRGRQVVLSLGEAGSIGSAGQVLTATGAARKEFTRR